MPTAEKKVTVNLYAEAAKNIERMRGDSGIDQTTVINRGVNLLALYYDTVTAGGSLQIRRADGATETIRFL